MVLVAVLEEEDMLNQHQIVIKNYNTIMALNWAMLIKDIQNLTTVNKYDFRANEMSLLINERFTKTSRLDSLSKDSD